MFFNRKKKSDGKKKYTEEELRDLHARAHTPTRETSHCFFQDGITREEFKQFAEKAGHQIRRITDMTICGAVIECTVQSQSNISEWHFKADFNDWGHLTGNYWIKAENTQSNIPKRFAKIVSDEISKKLASLPIEIIEYKDLYKNE